jgi:hypothetical protein
MNCKKTALLPALVLVCSPLLVAQRSGPEVSFCPAGIQADGFIDWTKLPKSAPSSTFNVTIPVSGVANHSVGFGIVGSRYDPLESIYDVENPAVLFIPLAGGTVDAVNFFFSRPVRGVSVTLQTAGQGGYQVQLSGFSSMEDVIANAPQAQVTSDGSDDPARQFSTTPLEIQSTAANLIAATLRFTANPNNYGSFNLVNFRVDSGAVPDPAKRVPTSGLMEWLRADRVNINPGSESNAGQVISWPDQSGHHADATPPNASAAPFSMKDGPNCKPVISFNGQQSLGFNLPINGWTGMTVFLAAQSYADAPAWYGNQALLWNETASWGRTFFTPSQTHVFFRFGTTQANNQPIYNRPFNIGGDFGVITAIHGGNTDTLFVNGVLALLQAGKFSSIAGTSATASIGGGTNNTFFTGNIGEILVYNRALSTTEREAVEHYLITKYGVQ